MSKISIIIPTINEANNLPLLLSDLLIIPKEAEILIVDCGSEDKTIDIGNIYGAKVYKSKERNRGLQLDIGAKNSKGDWLIFLHADTRLTNKWFTKIKSVFKGDKKYIYYFKFKINNKKIIYRFLEPIVNFRSKYFKEPYGDQGLIIHRSIYFKNNGFRNIALMEDLDFIRRLKKKKDLKQLNLPIFTSSRKWEKTNVFLQAFKNWNFRRRWLNGESTKSIYSDYYKK
ncbi:glycosyltransferase family 2 protein [Prochlorococcus marinus XMU1411]|uniref:TIGR04283 family arsenosugar biosynthesis glycosyltransferase n=1 Tax=Prochlorococcus marinus TaxID=1219 RepID=UPI001ADA9A94|nr:TIGR04283 family arsenosugar biosynthesis glycosyltransferase [Prochlorococcus marinus]MBO8243429.1 glycosyltransferase family 2 protein [Prochlorococcus marinus XMU1411]MBW3054544.1 cell wall biosynthesis glycosyltransferase [Prochlorococcus marinus str. MU1411]MCR8538122.1 TIGR04283 family arsenosugar biosynthesis glycosyltransferase [Prochlorococcus marinus CUG1430]